MTTLNILKEKISGIYHIDVNTLDLILESFLCEEIDNKAAYHPRNLEFLRQQLRESMLRNHPMDFDRLSSNDVGVESLFIQLLDALNEGPVTKIADTSAIQSKEDGFAELSRMTGIGDKDLQSIFEDKLSSKIITTADLNNTSLYQKTLLEALPLLSHLQTENTSQRYYDAVLRKVSSFFIAEKIQDFQTRGILTPPEPRNTVQTLNVTYNFGKNKSE